MEPTKFTIVLQMRAVHAIYLFSVEIMSTCTHSRMSTSLYHLIALRSFLQNFTPEDKLMDFVAGKYQQFSIADESPFSHDDSLGFGDDSNNKASGRVPEGAASSTPSLEELQQPVRHCPIDTQ